MGLGKTLQTIMLILKNPAPPGWAVQDFSEAKGKQSRTEDHLCPGSWWDATALCIVIVFEVEIFLYATSSLFWVVYSPQERE